MLALISEMNDSIVYWLSAQFKATPPVMLLAQDASPYEEMRKRFRKIAKQWLKKFDDAAPKIAEAYLKGSFKATDSAMRMALKDAGLAVKFEMSPAMRDAFNASLSENIGLIKSIPEQYLQKVEGVVARGYARHTARCSTTRSCEASCPTSKPRSRSQQGFKRRSRGSTRTRAARRSTTPPTSGGIVSPASMRRLSGGPLVRFANGMRSRSLWRQ